MRPNDAEKRTARGERRSRPTRRSSLSPSAAWKIAAVLSLGAALGSCSRAIELRPVAKEVPRIRVLLFDRQNPKSVKVTIDGPYRILLVGETDEPRTLASGDGLSSQKVGIRGTDVIVDGLVRTPCMVEFVPEGVPVEVNGRRYRGLLQVKSAGGRLRLINVVDLEGYLCGVVPAEVGVTWPSAALRAQVIAARSYALVGMAKSKNENKPFDVYDSVRSQVYRGLDKEDSRTNAAVAATAAQVLR